eukprot:6459593-Amphidinium_carterae.1
MALLPMDVGSLNPGKGKGKGGVRVARTRARVLLARRRKISPRTPSVGIVARRDIAKPIAGLQVVVRRSLWATPPPSPRRAKARGRRRQRAHWKKEARRTPQLKL